MGLLGRRRPGPPFVIAGIGNPGAGYSGTRHNLGAMVVEELARRLGVEPKRTKGKVRAVESAIGRRDVLLGLPLSYMNESGPPVLWLVRKAGGKPEDLLVVHDELDIPLGRIRLKAGGGTAGHRGIQSVCDSLRSRDFLRLRLGIGRPDVGADAVDKVLGSFAPDEKEQLPGIIDRAIRGIEILLDEGLDAAQRHLHAPQAAS